MRAATSGTAPAGAAAPAPAPSALAGARPASVQVIPGARGAEDGIVRLLAASPRLAPASGPVPFVLRLALARRPDAAEPEVGPLVTGGRLTLAITVEPEEAATARAARQLGRPCAPLLVRAVEAVVEAGLDGRARALGAAVAAGPLARLVLELGREDAFAALRAAQGGRSGLRVRARVAYDGARETPVELHADAAAVRAFLAPHADRAGRLSEGVLGPLFSAMLRAGIVTVDGGRGAAIAPELLPLFDAFVAAAGRVLEPLPPARPLDLGRLFSLGNGGGELRGRAQVAARAERAVELASALEALLVRGAEPVVTLEAPDPADPSRLAPVPPRVERPRSRAAPPPPGGKERVPLVAVGGPRSLALALSPDRAAQPAAHALLASSVAHAAGPHVWLAHDLVFDPPSAPPVLPLPIVEDAGAPLWPDRSDPGHRFYAPAFELVRPQPTDAPDASAFLFWFEQTGVTAGPSPRPGLHARVRFTLRARPSDATQAALAAAGNPPASPVPTNGLSATLEVPYRAEGTGETGVQRFAGTVTAAGDRITVDVELLDDWVRLLYGALAYEGFQAAPARLSLAYGFPAYQPIPTLWLDPALTHKLATIQVVRRAAELPARIERPVVDAETRTVFLPGGGQLRLGTEPRVRAGPASVAHAAVAHGALQPAAATATAHPAPHETPIAAAVAHVSPAALTAALAPVARFATRTVVHEEAVDALFACGDYGNFYVQATPTGDAPIGCRDALKLGELVYRQYEEIPSLRAPGYQVWRSLQQPGRFLIAPARYRVTRYAATEPPDRAYRPVFMIYAQLAGAAADTRYLFAATLEPDVPYAARRELEPALAALAPAGTTPALDFPTDPVVNATAAFAWVVPDGVEPPQVDVVWNGLQVSVSTDLAHGVVLEGLLSRSGLVGSATFTLADGTVLRPQLLMDLGVTGPWIGGPIAVTRAGGLITLRNPLAQAVDVGDVVVARASLRQRLPVGARLAPDESRVVDAGAPVDDAWAEATAEPPATIEELDVFEEDVTTNVVFANQVNYANHALASLSLAVRIRGSARVVQADLPEGKVASVDLVFPLTRYLDAQVAEFQVTKTYTQGDPRTTAWIAWDLGSQGGVIGVTSKLIEEEA